MPYKPPIKIPLLKKTGVLDENRFYRLLSEQCNYVNVEDVKSFYMGLVRLMTQEIRNNGIVALPHIGFFSLVKKKKRTSFFGKPTTKVSARYTLTFYPSYDWRWYFYKFVEKRAGIEPIDPRERLLHEKLE